MFVIGSLNRACGWTSMPNLNVNAEPSAAGLSNAARLPHPLRNPHLSYRDLQAKPNKLRRKIFLTERLIREMADNNNTKEGCYTTGSRR